MNKKEANQILSYVAENFVSPLMESVDESLFDIYAGEKFKAFATEVNKLVTLEDNNKLLLSACRDFFYLPSYTIGLYDVTKKRILFNHPDVPTHIETNQEALSSAIRLPCGTTLGYLVVYEKYSRQKEDFLEFFVKRIQKRLRE